MRIIILAALFACALSAEVKPKWVLPRLPLDFILSGKAFLVDENSRIVGGSVVTPYSLPFQISLQRRATAAGSFSHSCGGSILNEVKILNAAHCVVGAAASNLQVVAGEHTLYVNEGREQIRTISKLISHPSYNSGTYENDVAVIILNNALDLSSSAVGTIRLAEQGNDPLAESACTVSGWGTTSESGSLSTTLRSVSVNIVDRSSCNTGDYAGQIKDNMICAGTAGKDSCQGDSGGPLFTGTGVSATQIGIVSWGYGCARPGLPGVYTRVGSFNTWINGQN